jgi:hypothetical protein
VPEHTASEVGMVSENKKIYKSPVTVHVVAELIRAESRRLYCEMQGLIYCIVKKGRTA